MRWMFGLAVLIGAIALADRVFLWMESKIWINYRRRGLSRPGAAYHALILESIFNPAAENIRVITFEESREETNSAAPWPEQPNGGIS